MCTYRANLTSLDSLHAARGLYDETCVLTNIPRSFGNRSFTCPHYYHKRCIKTFDWFQSAKISKVVIPIENIFTKNNCLTRKFGSSTSFLVLWIKSCINGADSGSRFLRIHALGQPGWLPHAFGATRACNPSKVINAGARDIKKIVWGILGQFVIFVGWFLNRVRRLF